MCVECTGMTEVDWALYNANFIKAGDPHMGGFKVEHILTRLSNYFEVTYVCTHGCGLTDKCSARDIFLSKYQDALNDLPDFDARMIFFNRLRVEEVKDG